MLIDFHTHFFPDDIALKTVTKLGEEGNVQCYGDGTVHSLRRYMSEEGVDFSINLPIATRPEQVESINQKVIEFNKSSVDVIGFGTMHPKYSKVGNVREELETLKENGIKGIKLHPEYQEFFPDDPMMTEIYEECTRLELIIVFHAGRDVAFKEVHGTPKRFAQIRELNRHLKIVLAHMGGYRMWEEAESYVMGLHEVYIDTSFCTEIDDWLLKEMIFGHGAYKVLFGSDFPWERPSVTKKKILDLGLGAMYENMIFFQNAKRLLKIQ
ncbi:MAG: amidohydrolase family protein [Brevinematales bacterium]|nr:amidohydrolase family protein [Brevinematales bacterium]